MKLYEYNKNIDRMAIEDEEGNVRYLKLSTNEYSSIIERDDVTKFQTNYKGITNINIDRLVDDCLSKKAFKCLKFCLKLTDENNSLKYNPYNHKYELSKIIDLFLEKDKEFLFNYLDNIPEDRKINIVGYLVNHYNRILGYKNIELDDFIKLEKFLSPFIKSEMNRGRLVYLNNLVRFYLQNERFDICTYLIDKYPRVYRNIVTYKGKNEKIKKYLFDKDPQKNIEAELKSFFRKIANSNMTVPEIINTVKAELRKHITTRNVS